MGVDSRNADFAQGTLKIEGVPVTTGGGGGTGLAIRSGVEAAVNFTGNPKTATVTFSSPVLSLNYTPHISFETPDGYAPSWENITLNGFDINLRSNLAPTNAVGWTIDNHG